MGILHFERSRNARDPAATEVEVWKYEPREHRVPGLVDPLSLYLEKLDADFGRAIWDFVRAARHESLEADEDQRSFYRFQKPRVESYPTMVELFSRVPDALAGHIEEGHLTPIPVSAEVSSLSATLLDDDYHAGTHEGRVLIAALLSAALRGEGASSFGLRSSRLDQPMGTPRGRHDAAILFQSDVTRSIPPRLRLLRPN